jgi:hypothetical protein
MPFSQLTALKVSFMLVRWRLPAEGFPYTPAGKFLAMCKTIKQNKEINFQLHTKLQICLSLALFPLRFLCHTSKKDKE